MLKWFSSFWSYVTPNDFLVAAERGYTQTVQNMLNNASAEQKLALLNHADPPTSGKLSPLILTN